MKSESYNVKYHMILINSTLSLFSFTFALCFDFLIDFLMYCDMDANEISCFKCGMQVVYILDQVRALENEMVFRMQKQGLDVDPKILIVSLFICLFTC